ncbi:MAG: hypothetical protein GY929_21300 [Actinomycetia bacterium]|nr:hypothetical protein [Actinomycetes bacterium]
MNWDRIETMGRALDLTDGVAARTADPYWLLSRQWQVGEFQGDLGGQPVTVLAERETHPIVSFRPGPGVEPESLRTDDGFDPGPLEARVERTPPPATGLARAQEATDRAEELARLLEAKGFGDARELLRTVAPLAPDASVTTGLAAAAARLLAARGIDGLALVDDDERWADAHKALGPDAAETMDAWRLRHRAPESGWDETRLEYRASVAAMTSDGEKVFAAREHHGGHLDWYHFDLVEDDTHDLTKQDLDPDASGSILAIPTPAGYVGQPASRWWEFEDGRVHLGDLQAGATDFGRLAVAEFAMAYADDWFVVPVRVKTGTISRVSKLRVVDSFGDESPPIPHVRHRDGPQGPFRLFELHGDKPVQTGDPASDPSPWLFLPPATATSIEGPPLEQVVFARDEQANLAWAIEQQIEGAFGRVIERSKAWFSSADAAAPSSEPADDEEAWRYRVEVGVPPPWWIPLLPQRLDSSDEILLRRGRMRAWDDVDGVTGAVGDLLGGDEARHVEEDEVPRFGVTVDRRWQMARGLDGRVHVWSRWRKRPGGNARSSGLRWDDLQR